MLEKYAKETICGYGVNIGSIIYNHFVNKIGNETFDADILDKLVYETDKKVEQLFSILDNEESIISHDTVFNSISGDTGSYLYMPAKMPWELSVKERTITKNNIKDAICDIISRHIDYIGKTEIYNNICIINEHSV